MAEYIDRTALGIGYADPKVFINPAHADGWNTAVQIINEAPAADVAPVVHAHWRKSKEGVCGDYLFVCSACGEDYWESPPFYRQAHYCPNCGAKMDIDEEGET